jgi:hypothetical protein
MMEKAGRAIALRALGRRDQYEGLVVELAAELPHVNNSTKAVLVDEVIDGLVECGRVDELEGLIPAPEVRVMVGVRGQLERGRAALLVMRGETELAEQTLAGAVDALRSAESPLNLARGLLDHARLLGELGRGAEAQPRLHEARTIFTALGATPWLARVEALMTPDAAAAAR